MTGWTCREFEEHMGEFADIVSTQAWSVEARAHLECCPRCRETAQLTGGIERLMANPDSFGSKRAGDIDMIRVALSTADEELAQSSLRRRSWIVPMAAAAVLLLGALAGYMVWSTDLIRNRGADGQPPLQVVQSEETAETGAHRTSIAVTPTELDENILRVRDGVRIWVAPSARLARLRASEALDSFRLATGRVVVSIDDHPPGYRFVIETPRGAIEAKGTVFAVEVLDKKQWTRVVRGVVEVRETSPSPTRIPASESKAFLVSAGQLGVVGELIARTEEIEILLEDACMVSDCGVGALREQVRADLRSAIDLVDSLQIRATDSDEPKMPSQETPRKDVKRTVEHPVVGPGEVKANREAHLVENQPDKTPTDPRRLGILEDNQLPDLSETQMLEQAMAKRVARDWKGAREMYRELIAKYPNGAQALQARVSLGQLYLIHFEQPKEAAIQFDSYLDYAPGGSLAEEARLGAVRARRRAGEHRQTITAADAYLAHHGNGYGAVEVRYLRAQAHMARNSCTSALEDLNAIIEWWPTSAYVERARKAAARCR